MRSRPPRVIGSFACLLATICCACRNAGDGSHGAGRVTCLPVRGLTASTCWEQVVPLGNGGFPPEAGSNDAPKWEPGRWPMTLVPVIGWGDDLWMMSQTNTWSSSDGLHWTHYQKADWVERIGQAYAFFANRLWMFGGLRYADRVPLNDVWSSTDGMTWAQTGAAEWAPRKGQTVVAFGERLWLFGGADRVRADFSTAHALNDVWSSRDGLHWQQLTAAAPWAPREGAKVVVLDNALYLLGGQGQADVWRSGDGVTWTQLAGEADWKARFDYGAEVFAGHLWIYGGWQGTSTNALNDIWYSTDGKTWTRQTEHAPWAPRGPRTIVYKDKLWIFSGKHTGGADNWGGDIWTMTLSR